jgi:hypothetical protein
MILRVFANQHCKPNVLEVSQEGFMPQFGAFLSWRQITRFACPWIAKPHRNESHQASIVKLCAFDSHPGSQSITTRVIPGNTRFMDPTTGCLADDQNFRGGIGLKYRTWAERQMLFALPALTNLI